MFLVGAAHRLTEVTNVTYNQGLIPIDLGLAKLRTSYHTFIQYYSLKEMFEQLTGLDLFYKEILKCIQVQ